MPRFRNKVERTVVLECLDCGGWHDYPLREFRQDHLKRYLKQGYVTQHCTCDGKTADGNGNTHHKVVGWIREEQRRLTPGGVTRFLNKLAQGKRKK
jgi:hypothetical protein